MTAFAALLRAVNVGGTGKLPMADLRRIAVEAGFAGVATYIASGNLVFSSPESEPAVKKLLEDRLEAYSGKRIAVCVRTAEEMAAVAAANPFGGFDLSRTVAIFLDAPPPGDAVERVSGRIDEEIALGSREIYVAYPGGMGRSRLRIPAAAAGTARNMNTVAKLAEMAADL